MLWDNISLWYTYSNANLHCHVIQHLTEFHLLRFYISKILLSFDCYIIIQFIHLVIYNFSVIQFSIKSVIFCIKFQFFLKHPFIKTCTFLVKNSLFNRSLYTLTTHHVCFHQNVTSFQNHWSVARALQNSGQVTLSICKLLEDR